jgi:histidine ammonia-lyase
MVVRANQLGAGGAGVSAGLLDALVSALNDDFVPPAHEVGSLGTADLTILAEIALALIDRYDVELGPRDGIGFMSSNAEAIGHSALLAVSARRRLEGALGVAALSFLAAGANPIVLDERVHAARAHPGQVEVAARMRELLGAEAGARQGTDSPVQDPFPFRAFAQVEGLVVDALDRLDGVLRVELNAAAENALVDTGDTGEAAVLPNANFHAGALALALDGLRAALAQSASLGASRVTAMLEPDLTGLPPMLASHAGPSSGAMMLEYTAHPAAAEVRVLAAPVTAQATSVGGGTESHASFAPLAARMTERALDAAGIVTATELVVAVRGLRMRDVEPSGSPAGDLFERAAGRLDRELADRPLTADLEAAADLLFGED